MKIALCFYGLCDNVNYENNYIEFKKSFESIKENIIQNNECDIFIDTITQIDTTENDLLQLFNPKAYTIDKKIRYFVNNQNILNIYKKINIAAGRWYSQKNVIKLKNDYEIKNNFKYDVTFLTRFDCTYFTKFNFNELNLNKLYFGGWEIYEDPNLDYLKTGIDDLWFFGNSEIMYKFSLLFDDFIQLVKKINHTSNHLLAINYIKQYNIPYQSIKNHKKDYNITRRL
tara:strand:- start:1156 stop:1839 length:684 start_codon:yes stop_codon:yes gene_type:complete